MTRNNAEYREAIPQWFGIVASIVFFLWFLAVFVL